jgi:tetratricopeptide (TPR) repeat protein
MIKKILTLIMFALSLFAQQSPLDQNQFMLAESYEQRGDFAKAVEIIETLNKKDPTNIQYFNKLNALYLQLKKYDESVALINSRIKTNPQDISLYGMLGSTYYTAGDRTKAYQIWDDATNKFKDSQITYRVIANYAIEKRDFEKAIELLNRGKKISKDPYLYSYDLGELYNITMRYREAAEEYCKLIDEKPAQYSQIENKIISFSNKPNALKETIEVVQEYQSKDNINFSYLLARLYIENRDFDRAFDIYKSIDTKQQTQGTELNNFADYIYRDGNYHTALKIYSYLIDTYQDAPIAGTVKLGYAKTQEALLWENYYKENPEWKKYYHLLKIDPKKIEPVIQAYEDLIKIYGSSEVAVEANLRIGMLLFHLQDDFAGAVKYLKFILDKYSTSKFSSFAAVELGNISIIQAKLDEAEKYFETVNTMPRINADDKSFALYQLARINSFRGNFDKARKYLTGILNNLKDNIANDGIEFSILLNTAKNDSSNLALYCNAEFLSEQKRFAEAMELYLQLSQNPHAFIFQSIAKLRAAEMMIAYNDYDNAIVNLQLIVDEAEKNIYADKALYLQGQIYQYGLKDSIKAVESYESLLAKFSKSLYLDEARQNIIELKKKLS